MGWLGRNVGFERVLGNMISSIPLGVCFALKFVERRLTSFHIFNYLMEICNFSANYKI